MQQHEPHEHLAELAYHFFEAAPGGDAGKAIDYLLRAGDRAVGITAYEEAARLYGMGLDKAMKRPMPVKQSLPKRK